MFVFGQEWDCSRVAASQSFYRLSKLERCSVPMEFSATLKVSWWTGDPANVRRMTGARCVQRRAAGRMWERDTDLIRGSVLCFFCEVGAVWLSKKNRCCSQEYTNSRKLKASKTDACSHLKGKYGKPTTNLVNMSEKLSLAQSQAFRSLPRLYFWPFYQVTMVTPFLVSCRCIWKPFGRCLWQ